MVFVLIAVLFEHHNKTSLYKSERLLVFSFTCYEIPYGDVKLAPLYSFAKNCDGE